METINFGEEQNNSAPKAPNNRKKKLIWAGIVLAILIMAVIGWQYWQYTHSAYYQQMKAAKTLEKLYADDTMGGKTPEETLALFLEAVKKEDFDLASQYAIYGMRDSIKGNLLKIKNDGNINLLIEDLNRIEKVMTPEFGPDSLDFVIKENDIKKYTVLSMGKNKLGIWKINEF
jgi:hypothetical protein